MGFSDLFKRFLPKAAVATGLMSEQDVFFDDVINRTRDEFEDDKWWWNFKAAESEVFKQEILSLSDKDKTAFIIHSVKVVNDYHRAARSLSSDNRTYQLISIRQAFLKHLFKMRIEMDDDDFADIIKTAVSYSQKYWGVKVPLKGILNQLQKKYEARLPSPVVADALEKLLIKLRASSNAYDELETSRLREQVLIILSPTGKAQVTLFPGGDELPKIINRDIASLPGEERNIWYQLIDAAKKAGSAKPSKKYLQDGKTILDQLGLEKFKQAFIPWLDHLINLKEKQVASSVDYGYATYDVVKYEFLSAPATECFKGLIWLCAMLKDNILLNRIAMLADRAYRKIPGHGQTSTAIGNACLYTLYKTEGLEGIGHLSRLKVKIKLASTLNLIEKYLVQAAEDRNLPVDDIEDLAIDDHELVNHERTFIVGEFKAVLRIEKIGKVSLSWIKADGTSQKSEPVYVKESYPVELKEIKLAAKQIELSLNAQRDRIDASFKQGRKLSRNHFDTYYFNHGLISYLSRDLIWKFGSNEIETEGYWWDGAWVNRLGKMVDVAGAETVSLWHPSTVSAETVSEWRTFFLDKQIQQPIKQAFREVYLLTDAEINTRTYSNRMAGHILKQHQFNSLAGVRGWKYTIQGGFDNGANGIASIKLPAFNMIAEYWTNAVEGENSLNRSGIFNYIATDQVRFNYATQPGTAQLIDIPVELFSEVMRDVDLFVGVASVGNDPNWRDNGGLPDYRNYWQSYSFGELTEIAKGRKEILERLLPRLKIAKVAEIKDKFLVVTGKKRIYKIHLGSTNILMEPNDQYLCIVPDQSKKNITENVFLPFEGDNGLSVIISKAFLLADDDKIKDPTILSQIGR
ncbi:protein of unknown function [Mucilaginibacter gossypiicola]|uniref:Uncharacterized protein n=1 Tax=Mucilaginibacter gossypiicola TaxID=551995 RepID=A0A1H8GLF6_9SPHI|nr:DUF4132 domain-containing protein [Mucilaginibacter gossypiicola]SEN44783.1 protein of unknown function [Mucilaginibacter gossypiicola]